ncbi:MAG: hypothetical protein WCN92_06830, partial [Eubacteriales bacterium]
TGPATTFTVTVNPTPAVNNIANATYCNGAAAAAINFTSPTSGGTLTYNWTSNLNVGFGVSGAGDIPGYTATNATNSPVAATVSVTATVNGCTGPATTFTVTVNPTPAVKILIEQLYKMPVVTMYPKGGTAMLTVRQVAESIVGAALKNKGGNAYPISYYNLTWDEFLKIVHAAMGKPDRKIIHIAKWMFKLFGKTMIAEYKKKGIEPGLNPVDLAEIMCMNTFMDKKWSVELGVTDDDINTAIFDSVKLSVDAFTGKQKLVDMKSE